MFILTIFGCFWLILPFHEVDCISQFSKELALPPTVPRNPKKQHSQEQRTPPPPPPPPHPGETGHQPPQTAQRKGGRDEKGPRGAQARDPTSGVWGPPPVTVSAPPEHTQ